MYFIYKYVLYITDMAVPKCDEIKGQYYTIIV